MTGNATIREEQVIIPTYGIGKPNKNPMFLEKRVYQGSSGAVYPHPVIDRVYEEKQDKPYTAIFLENDYLEIMLLPEIGGRVQMARDKTNGYHFVYYNQVIKPALVGLTGPWISGGIEFNWPQHHRPSTFEPVDYQLRKNPDGSVTAWFSEIERMFRTKGMVGFTLYPDKAYLELNVQLYNRTPLPQTFLWWANPAVSVNDDYQSVFPPDVHAVMDHGKRDVSSFPIATGEYYKFDYAPGTDISLYKNIPVPTSYMAYHSDFDFVGCYDSGQSAGMMHVADHHTVPGKKQWTWGNGDFGRAWDRQLTDEDGPYIELMCGAFTDNQPDFSWLQPGEEKRFQQIFMPYKNIGAAKNANRDAVINLEFSEGQAHIGVYVSSSRTVEIQLLRTGEAVFNKTLELDPTTTLLEIISLEGEIIPLEFTLLISEAGQELIRFTPLPDEKPAIPQPATPAKKPSEIASNEELFLNGLHLEQYRHATYAPEPYYEEALRRDPGDSRCNNALGLLLLRHGKFVESEPYFQTAIKRLTLRNPNPYDGEPYYNLGLSLKMQGRFEEAYDAFFKATWNAAWRPAATFELALLDTRAGRLDEALQKANDVLRENGAHHKAHPLKFALLRHLGRNDEARTAIEAALALDLMNSGILFERHLLDGDTLYQEVMRGAAQHYIEIALDYAHAGLFHEAIQLLTEAPPTDPMVGYYLGWLYLSMDDPSAADEAFTQARAISPDYCFPNQVEAVLALQAALARNPEDPRAWYYLGNFWYGHRQYSEAIDAWERASQLDPTFPTVHRNLGLAYVNKLQDTQHALEAYETAFQCDPSDARVFFELDQLHKKMGYAPENRLKSLGAHLELVEQRDDLLIEYITLLNILGQHQAALGHLLSHNFHPWEGGEGKASGQYVKSLIGLARQAIENHDYPQAISFLERAKVYPHNLGEGKLIGAQDNHIHFYLGEAYRLMGETVQAREAYEQAAVGLAEPSSPLYYNDQPPEMVYFQGMANRALGKITQAEMIFQKLVDYGQSHLNDNVQMDYFAVSLPDFLVFDEDLSKRNQIHCYFMIALGYHGLGQPDKAENAFKELLALDPNYPNTLE
jgi:tetratricopeptide (TPR) repeat protein